MRSLILSMCLVTIAFAQPCSGPNQSCATKPCCDGDGTVCLNKNCKRVTTTTPTTPPPTDCVQPGLLCGQKGQPDTFKCCATVNGVRYECRQAEQSGGATGHAICLVRETTPTTLPPMVAQTWPRRFEPADVGLAYYASSDDINYDPRDGSYANQYVKQQRIEYAWFVMFPKVVGLMDELGLPLPSPNTVQENMGKFIFGYGCRYIRCDRPNNGEQYVWRANYLVDRWRKLLVQVQQGLKGDAGLVALQRYDWLPPLMGIGVTPTPRQPKPDKRHENEGELDGDRTFKPLSAYQCAMLAAAEAAHAANDQAGIVATQLAFEATARDIYEAALFAHQFPFGVNADKSPARRAALDAKKHAAYHEWVQAFGCETGAAPTTASVVGHRWKHVRVHVLRALPEGYYLRELCGEYIDKCPVTGE